MEEIIIDIKELEEITISDDSEVIIIGGSGGISPTVEGNTLILSSGKIEGGVLSI